MTDIYIIIIIEAIIASLYFYSKRKEIPAFKILSIFLMLMAFPMLINIIRISFQFERKTLFSLSQALPFTYGAMLYLYSIFIIDNRDKLNKKDFFHLIPFLSLFITLIFGLEIAPLDVHFNPHTGMMMKHAKLDWKWVITFTLLSISFIYYTTAIIIKLKQHKENLGKYYSNESSKISLDWLKRCAIVFLVANIIINTLYVLFNYIDFFGLSPHMINSYGVLVFIFIFSLFAASQAPIYKENNEEEYVLQNKVETHNNEANNIESTVTEKKAEKKYETSRLGSEEISTYLVQIEEYIKDEKPFLENELTIVEFSKALKINRNYVTQILNDKLNMNFKTYINKHRIEFVIELMKDNSTKDLSLLEIAMEAGFNSKATFNRVFKEKIGKTPTEYRKSLNA